MRFKSVSQAAGRGQEEVGCDLQARGGAVQSRLLTEGKHRKREKYKKKKIADVLAAGGIRVLVTPNHLHLW